MIYEMQGNSYDGGVLSLLIVLSMFVFVFSLRCYFPLELLCVFVSLLLFCLDYLELVKEAKRCIYRLECLHRLYIR